jgi:energy-coupling factor transporter ATP-binding protein EcfA2
LGLVFQDFEAQLFSTNVELEVARMRPTAVGMGVDALTPEQEEFLRG